MYKSYLKPAFFEYTHSPVAVTHGGLQANAQINISNDSDFQMYELRAIIYGSAVMTGGLMLTMSLANGELFSNVAIDLNSFASQSNAAIINAGYPVRLPEGVVIPSNSVINLQFTNNSGAADVVVQVQLWGYKCEKAGQEVV
jgi:hypothetical protein